MKFKVSIFQVNLQIKFKPTIFEETCFMKVYAVFLFLFFTINGNSQRLKNKLAIGPKVGVSLFENYSAEAGVWFYHDSGFCFESSFIYNRSDINLAGLSLKCNYLHTIGISELMYGINYSVYRNSGKNLPILSPEIGIHAGSILFSYGYNFRLRKENNISKNINTHYIGISCRAGLGIHLLFDAIGNLISNRNHTGGAFDIDKLD